MSRPKILVATLSLIALSSPSIAATAHNSQAGAYGSTKNNCAGTPYFQADSGCLSSALKGIEDDGALPPPGRYYRRGRPDPRSDD